MSNFGLVHGGGFGAWCWSRVIPELETLGHRATAVDLTVEEFAAGAARCAEVASHAFAQVDDIVVVGHSIAGLIIPLLASTRSVRCLIFLHALLPRPGQSVVDQVTAQPDMFNPDLATITTPFWEDEAVAVRFLLHDCQPEVAHDAFRRLRPEPGVLGREITPLQRWPDVPSAYIVCADDRIANPAWARRVARQRLGVAAIEIPGGHCPMLSRPKQLAEALDRCARVA